MTVLLLILLGCTTASSAAICILMCLCFSLRAERNALRDALLAEERAHARLGHEFAAMRHCYYALQDANGIVRKLEEASNEN